MRQSAITCRYRQHMPSSNRKRGITRPASGATPPVGHHKARRSITVPEMITALTAIGALIFTGLSLNAALENNKTNEESQFTDRYSRAVAQLDQAGPEHLHGRIGTIYAFERIARDSPRDQPSIVEMLSAFVRTTRPTPTVREKRELLGSDEVSGPELACPSPRPLEQDARAALTVLGRRDHTRDNGTHTDLTRTCLNGVDLRGLQLDEALLSGADLDGSSLIGSHLSRADLRYADLRSANFNKADLNESDLTSAYLNDAHLSEAQLNRAHLTWASAETVDLSHANLNGADLYNARLKRAQLSGAELKDALLEGANLTEANLFETNVTSANIGFSNLRGAQIIDTDLTGATLSGANLTGADLSGANLTNAAHEETIVDAVVVNEFTRGKWWQ